jgi:bacterioferritin-associated ferredoxin
MLGSHNVAGLEAAQHMYVCHCRAVTDCRIREVIAAGATDLGEVARRSGAGVTCGGCLPGVRRILVASRGEPETAPSRTPPSGTAPGSLFGPGVAVAGSARA